MKIKGLVFVNIAKVGELFHYDYAFFGKTLFKKHYYLTKVESPSPFFTWKEIENAILKNGYLFEDILEGGSIEIPLVGRISVRTFSNSDIQKYGADIYRWEKEFLDKTIRESFKIRKEYGDRSEEELRLYGGFFC